MVDNGRRRKSGKCRREMGFSSIHREDCTSNKPALIKMHNELDLNSEPAKYVRDRKLANYFFFLILGLLLGTLFVSWYYYVEFHGMRSLECRIQQDSKEAGIRKLTLIVRSSKSGFVTVFAYSGEHVDLLHLDDQRRISGEEDYPIRNLSVSCDKPIIVSVTQSPLPPSVTHRLQKNLVAAQGPK